MKADRQAWRADEINSPGIDELVIDHLLAEDARGPDHVDVIDVSNGARPARGPVMSLPIDAVETLAHRWTGQRRRGFHVTRDLVKGGNIP